MAKKWYVIHTQTGHEERVKRTIEKRMKNVKTQDLINRILVPTEQISDVKNGKKRISERKFFPGYVLVEMELSDESWYLIKNIPGVSGFIGSGTRPVALRNEEVENILKQSQVSREKPVPKVTFEKGEGIKVVNGPFANFNGTIEGISPEKGKLKVSIAIFGRSTPVELEYWQVEKV